MRSSFQHSLPSALARQLARGLPVSVSADAPRQDVAERLGQWLNVAEAIELHAAQAAVTAAGAAASRRPPRVEPAALHASLRAELERVRSVLTRSITTRPAHQPDPNDLDTEFAFFHQRLGDQQRRMELGVDALREHVRQQLAQSTPAMAQLAALDAVMDQLFGGASSACCPNCRPSSRRVLPRCAWKPPVLIPPTTCAGCTPLRPSSSRPCSPNSTCACSPSPA